MVLMSMEGYIDIIPIISDLPYKREVYTALLTTTRYAYGYDCNDNDE